VTRLVLVHGRDNQGLDAEEVERTWRTVLSAGLAAAGRPRVLTDDDAAFVFYGDTLAALVAGRGAVPPVTVHAAPVGSGSAGRYGARGPVTGLDARALAEDLTHDELMLLDAVATEVLHAAGTDAARFSVAQGLGADVDLGRWVSVLLSALDAVPGLSAAALVLLVRDVWAYLHDPEVRTTVDDALAAAMPTDEPAVVVGHSLGSVVAYSVLRDHDLRRDRRAPGPASAPGVASAADPASATGPASALGAGPAAASGRWDVPLFLTLGSPLAIRAIRDVLAARAPLRVPGSVDRWVAVRDRRDPLALHGLGPAAFPLAPGSPPVEDLVVENRAPGHHAAAVLLDDGSPAGYLALARVAGLLPDGTGTPPRTNPAPAR